MTERLAIAEPVKREPAYVEIDRLRLQVAVLEGRFDLAMELLNRAMGMRI